MYKPANAFDTLRKFTSILAVLVCVHLITQVRSDVANVRGERQRVYLNEFAVHVPHADDAAADRLAAKHGCTNRGQIGSLKGYYLFEHHGVKKRSVEESEHAHRRLHVEPEVHWVQQQHEKRRKKRDGADLLAEADTFFGSVAPGASRQTVQRRAPVHSRSVSPRTFPDPLFKEQWYLNGGAKDGLDMNLGPAWRKGYTGKGIVVSILDDGIQTNHPDLAQNYDPLASTDINDNDDDPMPQDNGDNKHGTRCAGEVAAVAFNQFCGIGVAYNASIGGVRMLDGTVNDAVEARALGLNPNHIDIYSASWGPEDDGKTVDGPGPLARRAFIYGVTSGREGKGSIFVWASGNGGRHTDSCNCDGYTNSIFTLSISSATQGGYKPWYLEECSSTLASTYSSGTPGHDKSVASVDMDGRLRSDHICTVEHTGTSASAPLAAGMCALALEANPSLTWRDMQYLVVLTSRSVPLEKESGWITNGVKRRVSHKFGYGLMDAGALVALAERWSNVPPQHICKSQEVTQETTIDSTQGYTLQLHMDVNGCKGTLNEVQYLEHVQCKITLRFFPRGNLKILLTSPMGTKSTLLFERPRDVIGSNFEDWPFLSVHFWGEKADGRWTLQIQNSGNRHVNQPGVLKKWQLIFYGTSINPVSLRPPVPAQNPFNLWKSPVNTFQFQGAESHVGAASEDFFTPDVYRNFQNYPNVYNFAGSEPEQVVATMDGERKISRDNTDVNAAKVNVTMDGCDFECDAQYGCYGAGPKKCVNCRNNKMDDECVANCPPRSYADERNVCRPCHDTCDTCFTRGPDSCLRCAAGYVRITDLGVCLQQCPEGYYEDKPARECVPCAPTCGSCAERPDHCTACDHHLILLSDEHKCVAACPSDMYETELMKCEKCHPTCDTCLGPSASNCVTCPVDRYEYNGTCVTQCPATHYANVKRQECVKCQKGCAACDRDACFECMDGWYLDDKARCRPNGTETCKKNEFFTEANCHDCASECETCNGPDNQSCLTCKLSNLFEDGMCVAKCSAGFYLERGRCVRCLHTCLDCVSRMNCTKCAHGLYLENGQCRTMCSNGYYSDLGVCLKCHMSCDTCSGPGDDKCLTCPASWVMTKEGRCQQKCPDGWYQTAYGCTKCDDHCKNCLGCRNQGDLRRSMEYSSFKSTASGYSMNDVVNALYVCTAIICVTFLLIVVVKNFQYRVSLNKPKVTWHYNYNMVAADDSSSENDDDHRTKVSIHKKKIIHAANMTKTSI